MEEYYITELTLREYRKTLEIKKALRLCKKHGAGLFALFKKGCRELEHRLSEKYLKVHLLYKGGGKSDIYCPAIGYAYTRNEDTEELLKTFARKSPFYAAECDMAYTLYRAALLTMLTKEDITAAGIKTLLHRFIGNVEINTELLCSLSPAAALLESSADYLRCTSLTKAVYRKKLSMTAAAAKVDEQRLVMQYLSEQSTVGKSPCLRISEDYRNVFPLPGARGYILRLFLLPLILLAAVTAAVGTPLCMLLYLPFYGGVKFVSDRLLERIYRRRTFPPAAEDIGEKIPKKARTLCVISTLLTSAEDVKKSIEKASAFLDKNRTDNLSVCLLCDLPEGKEKRMPGDGGIINACRGYEADPKDNIFIMLRERSYSKRAKLWRGHERKRGAIADLVNFLYGKRGEGVFIYGKKPLRPRYLLLLDYDTACPISGAAALVGIAEAAENRPVIENGRVISGYGAVCPEMVNSLYSTMGSGFAKLIGGDGGTAQQSYFSGGDFYGRVFGSGIFGGKGLIDLEAFKECCMSLPEETILSHDILEGSLLRCIAATVQFTESFPQNSVSYYARLCRWQRGDIQNIVFLIGRKNKGIIKDPLDRFKLTDNILRILLPISVLLCVFTQSGVIALTALMLMLLPFIPQLFAKGKYLSGALSARTRGIFRILCEVIMLPKNAVCAALSLTVTAFRAASGGDMLKWVTSYQAAKIKNGSLRTASAFFLPTVLCILLTAFSLSSPVCFVIGALPLSAIPVFTVLDKKCVERTLISVTEKQKRELIAAAAAEFCYYREYVTEKDNFLPPDNVQLSPVFAVAHRTSPTNIGMYLLSLLSVYEMGIIGGEEYESRVLNTLDTVKRLKKQNGNLYNWYDTVTLRPLDGFVSSVDSGNFVCCLTAVKAAAKGVFDTVYKTARELCDDTDLSLFYNKKNGLLAIGYDDSKKKLTESCYDLYMSEARMTSYYGVSKGVLPASHYAALSRIKGKCKGYSGCLSWSGTAFEYFMPQLLMPCPGAGLLYEALSYSAYCQKKLMRKGIYGISESGFYAFDKELNYQYRAFGAGNASLRPDYHFEAVYSPYSLFLMLPFDFSSAYNALVRMKEEGIYDERFGYYEAVDRSPERTGGKETVKSFMAHHKGMSIAAICNAVCDGRLVKLFMSDNDMKRGEELTQERITSGEVLYKNLRPTAKVSDAPTVKRPIGSGFIRGNRVSALMLSAAETKSGAAATELYGRQLLYYPAVFGQYDDSHPYEGFKVSVLENGERREIRKRLSVNKVWGVYENETDGLYLSEKVTACDGVSAFIHEFTVKNKEDSEKTLSLEIFMRMALGHYADVIAHPAFSDLFLSEHFDKESRAITVTRHHRQSGNVTAAAIRLSEKYFYCFDREQADEKPLCKNESRFIPAPCVKLTVPLIVGAGAKRTVKLIVGCGKSERAALSAAENAVSPFVFKKEECGDVCGEDDAIVSALLPALLLYRRAGGTDIHLADDGKFSELSALGINISKPAAVFTCGREEKSGCLFGILRASGRLIAAGLDFSLILLCEGGYERINESVSRSFGFDGSVTVLKKNTLSDRLTALLMRFCVYRASDLRPIAEYKSREDKPLAVTLSERPDPAECPTAVEKTGFCGDGFTITEKPPAVWSRVLANEVFGVLVSDNSLGFCWAKNSSLGMLTPWDNDLTGRNCGMRLYLRSGNEYCDILANAVCIYGKSKAEYISRCGGHTVTVSVTVPEKGAALIIKVSALPDMKVSAISENGGAKAPKICFCAKLKGEYALLSDGRTDIVSARCLSSEGLNGKVTLKAFAKSAEYAGSLKDFDAGLFRLSSGDTAVCDCLAAQAETGGSGTAVFILSYTSLYAKSVAVIDILADKKLRGYCFSKSGGGLVFDTGDKTLDSFINRFLPEQIIKGRIYARTGFYQCGGAYGFRDQLQDAMAAVYFDPDILKRLIYRSCAAQFSKGDVLHWYHVTENGKSGVRTLCSDDMLWLPEAVCRYIFVTGDTEILKTEIAYCTAPPLDGKREAYMPVGKGEKATVLEHCIAALEYAYKTGGHGLLLMGGGDWNDSFDLVGIGGKGESVWLSMFYCMVCADFCMLPENAVDKQTKSVYKSRADKLKKAINDCAFENGYYLRAFYDDGGKMGAEENSECSIDIISQSFSVLADINEGEQCSRSRSAVNIALARLCDNEMGLIKLFDPPFTEKDKNRTGYVSAYPEGIRENGGQYTHAALWLIMAVRKLGHTDEAYRLLRMISPFEKDVSVYKNEPYYMSADVYTNPQCYGRAGWSLYTGAAGWYYRAFLDIIGVEIRCDELIVTHAPPDALKGSRVYFKGKEYLL